MKAIYVPADRDEQVTVINIADGNRQYRQLQQLVHGYIERASYDRDSACLVNDEGRINGMPMNHRATNYVRLRSEAADKWLHVPADEGLYGPVLFVGENGGEEWTDVPERLVRIFDAQEIATEQGMGL